MKIALFGGTFDPIHHGHLLLARDAIEQLALDRVIFIPAALSPHKLTRPPTESGVRWEMLGAAIDGEPRFERDDSEFHRSGPSFSIDTVEQWRAKLPEAQFFYLIGADNLRELHTWRRIDELRRLAQFVVFGRGEPGVEHSFPVLPRRIDISASEIRSRVARAACIRYLVPESVRAIIHTNHLYEELPNRS
jgi:nicotinate-nucleotide adenylyltransferase